jgi:hypothetical protein
METKTRKPRTIKPKKEHVSMVKDVVSKALRQTWEYETALERFEKAKNKYERQLLTRKQELVSTWEAVVQAATAAKGKYAE